ncbi:MAG: aminopeptidase N, partial [Glaciecola sp.]
MKNAQASTTYLKDYSEPSFLIDKTSLHFDLFEDHAVVSSTLEMRFNLSTKAGPSADLVLNGQGLVLEG